MCGRVGAQYDQGCCGRHNDAMKALRIVGALAAAAWAVANVVQSHLVTAAVWGGVALFIGWTVFRPSRTVNGPQDITTGMRLYGIGFCIAMLAVAIGFAVAAAGASEDSRGTYIGVAVLTGAYGLAMTALVATLERKKRAWQRTEVG